MNHLTNKSLPIDRRKFLRTAAAVPSLFLLAPLTSGANAEPTRRNHTLLTIQDVEESIKVHFGSMFQVLSFQQDLNEKTTARIEHLENQFLVISDDLSHWKIIDSTEI